MLRPTSRADIILHNALQQIQNSNMVPMPKQQRHCRDDNLSMPCCGKKVCYCYASVTLQQLQGDHLEAASWLEKITSIEIIGQHTI